MQLGFSRRSDEGSVGGRSRALLGVRRGHHRRCRFAHRGRIRAAPSGDYRGAASCHACRRADIADASDRDDHAPSGAGDANAGYSPARPVHTAACRWRCDTGAGHGAAAPDRSGGHVGTKALAVPIRRSPDSPDTASSGIRASASCLCTAERGNAAGIAGLTAAESTARGAACLATDTVAQCAPGWPTSDAPGGTGQARNPSRAEHACTSGPDRQRRSCIDFGGNRRERGDATTDARHAGQHGHARCLARADQPVPG